MMLVICGPADHVVEKGRPCFVFPATLVRPKRAGAAASEHVEFEEVEWVGPATIGLPTYPRPGKRIGLVPYPHGSAPTLFVDDWKICEVWKGPIFILICIYSAQFVASEFTGKIYSAHEA